MSAVRRFLGRTVPPTIFFLVVIGGWYVVSLFVLDEASKFLLPPPHEVVNESILDEKVRSDMLAAFWVTAKVAVVGLGIAIVIGSVLAVIMSRAKWLERSFYPWVILLQTVPILAIVPVIGFWFGFDLFARVVVVVIIALFPLIINPLHGLQNVDPGLHDLFTLSNVGGITRLTKLQFPSALPDVFIGLQSAAGLAIVGATVGDYFFGRGQIGLGMLLSRYSSRLQSAEMLATVFVACLLGVIAFLLFGALGRRIVGAWSPAWGAR
ncbi:MAG: ABC transporter permease subunit [Actinomycetota bacterium]|nr:ABC transporter permease subunit [Actinomycetota bacterium]